MDYVSVLVIENGVLKSNKLFAGEGEEVRKQAETHFKAQCTIQDPNFTNMGDFMRTACVTDGCFRFAGGSVRISHPQVVACGAQDMTVATSLGTLQAIDTRPGANDYPGFEVMVDDRRLAMVEVNTCLDEGDRLQIHIYAPFEAGDNEPGEYRTFRFCEEEKD